MVAEALERLGVAGSASRERSAEAGAFNNASIDARHACWDVVAIGSESFLTSEDPDLYC